MALLPPSGLLLLLCPLPVQDRQPQEELRSTNGHGDNFLPPPSASDTGFRKSIGFRTSKKKVLTHEGLGTSTGAMLEEGVSDLPPQEARLSVPQLPLCPPLLGHLALCLSPSWGLTELVFWFRKKGKFVSWLLSPQLLFSLPLNMYFWADHLPTLANNPNLGGPLRLLAFI
jgi:hypothetical protein